MATDPKRPYPRFHEAYMFEMGEGENRVTGLVHKIHSRPAVLWQASVDGTDIRTTWNTRGGAVAKAWDETTKK